MKFVWKSYHVNSFWWLLASNKNEIEFVQPTPMILEGGNGLLRLSRVRTQNEKSCDWNSGIKSCYLVILWWNTEFLVACGPPYHSGVKRHGSLLSQYHQIKTPYFQYWSKNNSICWCIWNRYYVSLCGPVMNLIGLGYR